jgi:hypothetical protein
MEVVKLVVTMTPIRIPRKNQWPLKVGRPKGVKRVVNMNLSHPFGITRPRGCVLRLAKVLI